ncbi:MAG: transposase [Acidobacteriia bacterium]|nr:transposase [Terriglobia bacterium]
MALRHPAATGRNLGKLLAALSIAVKSEPASAGQRQRRSIAEKRRIVEQALVEGASVARIARAHGVNANQLFGWRRLGRLGEQKPMMKLLPVRVSESLPPVMPHASNEGSTSIEVADPKTIPGTIHIKLRQASPG